MAGSKSWLLGALCFLLIDIIVRQSGAIQLYWCGVHDCTRTSLLMYTIQGKMSYNINKTHWRAYRLHGMALFISPQSLEVCSAADFAITIKSSQCLIWWSPYWDGILHTGSEVEVTYSVRLHNSGSLKKAQTEQRIDGVSWFELCRALSWCYFVCLAV